MIFMLVGPVYSKAGNSELDNQISKTVDLVIYTINQMLLDHLIPVVMLKLITFMHLSKKKYYLPIHQNLMVWKKSLYLKPI